LLLLVLLLLLLAVLLLLLLLILLRRWQLLLLLLLLGRDRSRGLGRRLHWGGSRHKHVWLWLGFSSRSGYRSVRHWWRLGLGLCHLDVDISTK
jgi:hypothetical protein